MKHPFLQLRSVGPATLRDLLQLNITTLDALAAANPQDLYRQLCALHKQTIDICQYDVFCCAVAQARNPTIAEEQTHWDWWSKMRKLGTSPFGKFPDTL